MSLALRSDAADLYHCWETALRNGRAWEQLSDAEQAAWFAVVELAGDGMRITLPPECQICASDLVCPKCDELYCPECGRCDPVLCEDCWQNTISEIKADRSFQFCVGESR